MHTRFHSFFSKKLLIGTNLLTILLLVIILVKDRTHEFAPAREEAAHVKEPASPATAKTGPAEKPVSQEELAAMNNAFHPIYEDVGTSNNLATFRVLILGNSLSTHPIVNEIGWTHKSGMAATDISKDYVHLLLANFKRRLPDEHITLRVANFADFEREPVSLLSSTIDSLVQFKPDLVIFPLGENVPEEKLPIFAPKYIALIKSFKREKAVPTICTTPFFPSLTKNSMIDSVAMRTNSFLVDISHLVLLDKTNYAKNEVGYSGDRSKWKVSGIGMHPGDKGMRSIAAQLFITINGILSSSAKP